MSVSVSVFMSMSVSMSVCVLVRVPIRVCAFRVPACVPVRVPVRLCVHVRVRMCMRVRMRACACVQQFSEKSPQQQSLFSRVVRLALLHKGHLHHPCCRRVAFLLRPWRVDPNLGYFESSYYSKSRSSDPGAGYSNKGAQRCRAPGGIEGRVSARRRRT